MGTGVGGVLFLICCRCLCLKKKMFCQSEIECRGGCHVMPSSGFIISHQPLVTWHFKRLYVKLHCATGALGRCHSSAAELKADGCPFTWRVLTRCLIQCRCSRAADTFTSHHRFKTKPTETITSACVPLSCNCNLYAGIWINLARKTRIRSATSLCCAVQLKANKNIIFMISAWGKSLHVVQICSQFIHLRL